MNHEIINICSTLILHRFRELVGQ